jgi:hypothetical protein
MLRRIPYLKRSIAFLQITYAKKGANFKWENSTEYSKMMKAIWNEKN